MQRTLLLLAAFFCLAFSLALAAGPADAEPPGRPPKPYQTVAITLPAASTDASFEAFRRTLAAVATDRVYGELARLLEPQTFFWERDFAQAFDARRPAVDNLAAALRLEHAAGTGWRTLATFAAERTLEALASRPGIVCTPAPPHYDGIAFARMLDEAYGADLDWTYPRADGTPVHAAPQADAALVGSIGLHLVRRLGLDEKGAIVAANSQWAPPLQRLSFAACADLRQGASGLPMVAGPS